jgi:hypothetical protein
MTDSTEQTGEAPRAHVIIARGPHDVDGTPEGVAMIQSAHGIVPRSAEDAERRALADAAQLQALAEAEAAGRLPDADRRRDDGEGAEA